MAYIIKADAPEKFEFEYDGKTYSVPYLKYAPYPVISKYNADIKKAKTASEQADALIDLCSKQFEKHAPGVLKNLSMEQATDMFNAYVEEGKTAPGESQA